MSKQDSEKLLQGSVQGRIMERNISVIKDVNGNQIVIVNDIRFKGKRNIDWDDVEQYLKQYIGEFIEIAESKEIIYIGSDLPDEYSGSNYTAKLKGALAKAKANAAQGIPEMIEIAQNFGKIWKENMIKMRNMAGIDMIPDLQYQFLMKIMMFCGIIYFMQNW